MRGSGFRSRSYHLTSMWIVLAVSGLVALSCSSKDNGTASASASSPSASSACGSLAPVSGGVSAVEKDFSITLGSSSGSEGSTTFNIQNLGPSLHEFVVFKTDLPEDKLPLVSDGTAVDEEGAGVTHVDEVEDIAPCSNEALTVTLDPGSYVLICNITGHYGLGMHAALTVA
jgi:uncharacterized cupredoxin-like copper-binding protein